MGASIFSLRGSITDAIVSKMQRLALCEQDRGEFGVQAEPKTTTVGERFWLDLDKLRCGRMGLDGDAHLGPRLSGFYRV
jgi:hypothetical protein